MRADDRVRFQRLLVDAMAFYRYDMSDFALGVWWQACESFDFDQVSKALTAHAMDPERGQFAPKPADIVRQLQGTHGDRALVAWGKAYEAIGRVGSWSSVAFDDGVIHAVIEDMGGWTAICQTLIDDLPFLQRRFCDTYRAYAKRPDLRWPPHLACESESSNRLHGYAIKPPTLIGDPGKAAEVMRAGVEQSRVQITNAAELPLRLAQ